MSFAPQSVSNDRVVPTDESVDAVAAPIDAEVEEVDLESVEGRSLLIQEIENLALTCDVADNPELFAASEVFHLVAKLQAVLADIEQTVSLGEEVTTAQAQEVQERYDELAVEVEQPSIISVYVGPSRRDMVLEDLSDEGDIAISRPPEPEPEPEPEIDPEPESEPESAPKQPSSEVNRGKGSKASFIHHSLPQQSSQPKPASQSPAGPAGDQAVFEPEDAVSDAEIQKVIDKIEASEISFLDSWISDYQSPYKVLGSMPFAELRKMSAAPINSRAYVEFKSLLELENIKYEVFNQWSQDFDEMAQLVDRAYQKSFKQVLDEYLRIILTT